MSNFRSVFQFKTSLSAKSHLSRDTVALHQSPGQLKHIRRDIHAGHMSAPRFANSVTKRPEPHPISQIVLPRTSPHFCITQSNRW